MATQLDWTTRDFLTAATKVEVPTEVQALLEDAVVKYRQAHARWNTSAQANVKALEDVVATTQTGAKAIVDAATGYAAANIEAILDAAEELARAATIQEATQIQVRLAQQQLAAVADQTRGIFELSARVMKDTTEAMVSHATKAVGDLKTLL